MRGHAVDAASRGPQDIHSSMFRLTVAPGDTAWIADVNDDGSIVEIGCQNLRIIGGVSQLESLVRGWAELLGDLRARPELVSELLPVMKRIDSSARRSAEHPLVWTVD